jgi:hypothetical protein
MQGWQAWALGCMEGWERICKGWGRTDGKEWAMKNSGGLFILLGLGAVAYIWYQSSAVSSTVGSAANTANLLASAANPNAVPTVVSSTPIPFQATPGTGVGQLIYGPSIEQLTGAGA